VRVYVYADSANYRKCGRLWGIAAAASAAASASAAAIAIAAIAIAIAIAIAFGLKASGGYLLAKVRLELGRTLEVFHAYAGLRADGMKKGEIGLHVIAHDTILAVNNDCKRVDLFHQLLQMRRPASSDVCKSVSAVTA
jgi:hypothetical protein